MMYRINREYGAGSTNTTEGVDAGNDGVPLMVAEGQACAAGRESLGYYRDAGIGGCADACRAVNGCQYVMFDPNDGECLQSLTTAINCPEGLGVSSWYDFWAIDGGSFQ